ncbi:MAG: hypothetical protein F4057_01110 [Acidobacteria bacterium]|nr:hypothetical protein [Acidobacteriota bacterium]
MIPPPTGDAARDAEAAAAAAREPAAADELDVLFPAELEVTVRDPDDGAAVVLTLREFRLLDGLHAQAEARGLIAALGALGADEDMETEALAAVLAEHADEWLALLARATGRDAAWLARLADFDGHALSNALWDTNHPFFLSRMLEAVQRRRARSALASAASLANSSPPATDATSGTSPDA